MNRISITRVAALCGCAVVTMAARAQSAPAAGAPRIPLIVGLNVTSAVQAVEGDYESLANVSGLRAHDVQLTISGDAPQVAGEAPEAVTISRTVQAADLEHGHTIKYFFSSADPDVIPGSTAIGVSAAVLDDLRKTGKSEITLDGRAGGLFSAVSDLLGSAAKSSGVGQLLDNRIRATGVVSLTEPKPVAMSVLVNGRMTSLPAYHVRGHLGAGEDGEDADLFILDDSANPLVLRGKISADKWEVTKIEYPLPDAAASMERDLAKDRRSVLYGIYFDFNSATIRPTSEPVLEEIVTVMKREPTWKLRVEGHTDNVGGDKKNLDLSTRRAAAVKAALVQRGVSEERLDTGGYGSSVPKETNTTLQGRARNRRVELSRQ